MAGGNPKTRPKKAEPKKRVIKLTARRPSTRTKKPAAPAKKPAAPAKKPATQKKK
tara:strand:- start:837 stop:1001 length:165 start_codon:yes stop_codon:yes gene_type:complete